MGKFISKTQMIIENLINLTTQGLFSFVGVTTKKALKKSRVTKNPTPENLIEITVMTYATVSLGNNYQNSVNNRRVKEENTPDFQAKGTYCLPMGDNLILFKHKEKEQVYLRVYPDLCCSFKTVVKRFDKNGVEILDSQWKQIEAEYFELKSSNKEHQGVEKEIKVNNYKIENVKYLKRGDFVINELTDEIIKKLGI